MAAIGKVLVYRGLGALDDFAAMLLQRLQSLINPQHHVVGYITPEQIVKGRLFLTRLFEEMIELFRSLLQLLSREALVCVCGISYRRT